MRQHIETDLKHAATLRMSRPYYLGQCNARLRCQKALVATIAVIFRLLTNLWPYLKLSHGIGRNNALSNRAARLKRYNSIV